MLEGYTLEGKRGRKQISLDKPCINTLPLHICSLALRCKVTGATWTCGQTQYDIYDVLYEAAWLIALL